MTMVTIGRVSWWGRHAPGVEPDGRRLGDEEAADVRETHAQHAAGLKDAQALAEETHGSPSSFQSSGRTHPTE
jgi:hypothetical protein